MDWKIILPLWLVPSEDIKHCARPESQETMIVPSSCSSKNNCSNASSICEKHKLFQDDKMPCGLYTVAQVLLQSPPLSYSSWWPQSNFDSNMISNFHLRALSLIDQMKKSNLFLICELSALRHCCSKRASRNVRTSASVCQIRQNTSVAHFVFTRSKVFTFFTRWTQNSAYAIELYRYSYQCAVWSVNGTHI